MLIFRFLFIQTKTKHLFSVEIQTPTMDIKIKWGCCKSYQHKIHCKNFNLCRKTLHRGIYKNLWNSLNSNSMGFFQKSLALIFFVNLYVFQRKIKFFKVPKVYNIMMCGYIHTYTCGRSCGGDVPLNYRNAYNWLERYTLPSEQIWTKRCNF